MRTYLGTTHAHTGAFNTHGHDDSTIEEVFDAARGGGYDFLLLTEHTGRTGPRNPVKFYDDARRIAAQKSRHDFAAIAGYEYSDNRNDGDLDHGHLTAAGTDDFVDADLPGMDFTAFLAYLVEQAASRLVLAGFNHPPATGHRAAGPERLTPETRRLFALTETHGRATYRQARDEQYYAAMITHLDAGWRVAPTCGLDSHGVQELVAVESAEHSPCRTGVLATSLTPTKVLRAMRARRTYASRDMNLRLRYRANGRWMGAELGTPRRVDLAIRVREPDVADPMDRVSRIEVVGTGGVVLAAQEVNDHRAVWRPRVRTGGNTYLLVRVFTHDHPSATAVAAPVWVGTGA